MLGVFNFFNIFRRSSCHVFLYHRVANVKDDPHQLSVSMENFENQIRWLKDNTDIVPLSKLIQKLRNRLANKPTVCLTFDDGYADNYHHALPLLHKYKIPATFYITVGKIGDNRPFYWDYSTLREDKGRALTKHELISLSRSPFVEIGSHSLSHPHLPALPIMQQEKEISESKKKLETIIGKKIKSFSYPFGTRKDFNKETVRLVKTAGYSYACANFSGNVDKFSNPYTLPRVIIRNWPIKVFVKKIKRII